MEKTNKIIVTGGAGFIGRNLIYALNSEGLDDILIVDRLGSDEKWKNLIGLRFQDFIDYEDLPSLIQAKKISGIEMIFHFGACSDTQEKDVSFLMRVNALYSKMLFDYAKIENCRFIYASSAATYGNGAQGYNDSTRNLSPLNPYGYSKHIFDEWARNSVKKPLQWVGLKFFNVFGPGESHKDRMASVVFHGYHQIIDNGILRLFKSYNQNYPDGGQKRDFIYIKDAINIALFFFKNKNQSGIFNAGTGNARTFLDIGHSLFQSIGKTPSIEFIDMPKNLKSTYQYFTESDISSLRAVGFSDNFYSLENGIDDYVKNYLSKEK